MSETVTFDIAEAERQAWIATQDPVYQLLAGT